MTIDLPRCSHVPALRKLWQIAFGDSDAFLDDFFQTAFAPDRCRCLFIEDTPVAALYWFPTTLRGNPCAYLYAVATHPHFRGQGLAAALLQDTHDHLRSKGIQNVFLVPQDEHLRRYYERLGYHTCCSVREFSCSAGNSPVSLRQVDVEEYAVLRRSYLPEDGVLQEGVTLRFLDTQGHFYVGQDWIVFAYSDQSELIVRELLGNADAAPGILRTLGAQKGLFRVPGTEIPYAMCYRLEDGCEPDSAYLGLALD